MDFLALKDLIFTITRNKVKNIEVLGSGSNEDKRLDQLYNGIADGTFSNDEEAAQFFVGTKDGKDKNYVKLRARLIRQLMNSAYFIDVNQARFSDRHKAYHNCYADFAVAMILKIKDAPQAATQIFENVLQHAIHYEFIELAADITRYLRELSSRDMGNVKRLEHYTKLHRTYETKRRYEMISSDYYEELVAQFFNKKNPGKDTYELALKYYGELKPIAEVADTTQFVMRLYQIAIIRDFASYNYWGVLSTVSEFLEKHGDRKNLYKSSKLAIMIQKAVCYIQLKFSSSDEVDHYFDECMEMEIEGSHNWFRIIELRCYYYTHTKRYKEALKILDTAFSHPKYILLPPNIRDIWPIIGHYMHVLAALGQLPKAEVERVAGPYDYTNLVSEEIEMVNRDKDGLNIPIVMLPLLYALATGDLDAVERATDAADQYRKRYLRDDEYARSDSFMKIILSLPEYKFEPKLIQRRITREKAVIDQNPLDKVGQSYIIEVIPYEDLIALLLPAYGIKINQD